MSAAIVAGATCNRGDISSELWPEALLSVRMLPPASINKLAKVWRSVYRGRSKRRPATSWSNAVSWRWDAGPSGRANSLPWLLRSPRSQVGDQRGAGGRVRGFPVLVLL